MAVLTMFLKFYLVILVVKTVQSQLISDDELQKLDLCRFKKCLYKCCGKDEYMSGMETGSYCVKYNGIKKMDFSEVQLYDDEEHWKPVSRTFQDTFVLRQSLMLNDSFAVEAYVPQSAGMNSFLSESGILYLEYPHAYQWWTRIESRFCLDYFTNGSDISTTIWVNYIDQVPLSSDYISLALIISSFFLALLLIVYAILPELRNIGGMILMAYAFSLLVAFLTVAVIQMGSYADEICVALTITAYFFLLASFAWMNVMSYDIWWTFRGYAKARPIHRRGEKFKFCMYCLYAWGIPLTMALAFMEINNADLSDKPWIIKPLVPIFGCFIEGGQKFVYLYIPMLIMISGNWVFFGMTAFNVWRLRRGTAVLNSPAAGNPAAHRSQKQRFTVYLKLSVIMGINWLLEVVSYLYPDLEIWYITDAYNMLIGITIFFIFVWKVSILNKLKRKYETIRRERLPKRSLTTSITMESTHSQDTSANVRPYPNVQRKFSSEQKPFLP